MKADNHLLRILPASDTKRLSSFRLHSLRRTEVLVYELCDLVRSQLGVLATIQTGRADLTGYSILHRQRSCGMMTYHDSEHCIRALVDHTKSMRFKAKHSALRKCQAEVPVHAPQRAWWFVTPRVMSDRPPLTSTRQVSPSNRLTALKGFSKKRSDVLIPPNESIHDVSSATPLSCNVLTR